MSSAKRTELEKAYRRLAKRTLKNEKDRKVLPTLGKHRIEYYAFLEGAHWMLNTFLPSIDREATLLDALNATRIEALRLYPNFIETPPAKKYDQDPYGVMKDQDQ